MTGERTLPGVGLVGFWNLGDSTYKPGLDHDLLMLSALVHLSAKTRTAALPGSPAQGDIHLVPSGAGVSPNQIAVYDAGAWVYLPPTPGMRAFVQDESKFYYWGGAAWLVEPGSGGVYSGYDVPVYVPDKPTASMVCARIVAVRAFTLPAGLAGSAASAGVAATASAVFAVQKDTTQVGTVTFAAGSAAGTFAMASATSFAAGDVLRVIAPGTADATLADISITFMGSRT